MRYEAPDTAERAATLLADAGGEARVLAGGTDLLVQMRGDVVDPEVIVDIKQIAETRIITEEHGGAWRIGTVAPHRPVQTSDATSAIDRERASSSASCPR